MPAEPREGDTESLMNVSIRFPTVDRAAVADLIAPLMQAAVAAGGESLTISVQGYTPGDDDV